MLSHRHRLPFGLNRLPRQQIIDLVKHLSQLRACKHIKSVWRQKVRQQQTSPTQTTSSSPTSQKGTFAPSDSSNLILMKKDALREATGLQNTNQNCCTDRLRAGQLSAVGIITGTLDMLVP